MTEDEAVDTPAAAPEAASPDGQPAKKKVGRPKGSKKVPGSGRVAFANMTPEQIRNKLLADSEAIETLSKICRGEALFAGDDKAIGKSAWKKPSINQRLKAAELVIDRVLPSLSSTEAVVASVSAVANIDPEDVRRAVYEDLLARRHALEGGGRCIRK